jgi:hypothetical protein
MTTIDERVAVILESERRFAEELALRVIEKPTVSVWTILIPILFVYHMYRHSQYVDGRKQFVEHYLMSRTNAVREAAAALAEARAPDVARLAVANGTAADIQPLLQDLLRELVEHFMTLLKADGRDRDSLVRFSYESGTAYLLVMNRLNASERKLYEALGIRLQEQQEGANSMVASIEVESERLRREEAHRIFG